MKTANGDIEVGMAVTVTGVKYHGMDGIVEQVYLPPDPKMGLVRVKLEDGYVYLVEGVNVAPIPESELRALSGDR